MGAKEALRHILEPVPGATDIIDGNRIIDWDALLNDDYLARLSDGERALVQLGLQLYNGGHVGARGRGPDLHQCLVAIDADNRHRFVEALGILYDEHYELMSADPTTIVTTQGFRRK